MSSSDARHRANKYVPATANSSSCFMETLESRTLMSTSVATTRAQAHANHMAHVAHVNHLAHVEHAARAQHALVMAARAKSNETNSDEGKTDGETEQPIAFNAAPRAVRKGLSAIVPAGFVIPATQSVEVNTNDANVVIYSIQIRVKGKVTELGVRASGKAVKASELADNNNQDGNNDDSQNEDTGESEI